MHLSDIAGPRQLQRNSCEVWKRPLIQGRLLEMLEFLRFPGLLEYSVWLVVASGVVSGVVSGVASAAVDVESDLAAGFESEFASESESETESEPELEDSAAAETVVASPSAAAAGLRFQLGRDSDLESQDSSKAASVDSGHFVNSKVEEVVGIDEGGNSEIGGVADEEEGAGVQRASDDQEESGPHEGEAAHMQGLRETLPGRTGEHSEVEAVACRTRRRCEEKERREGAKRRKGGRGRGRRSWEGEYERIEPIATKLPDIEIFKITGQVYLVR